MFIDHLGGAFAVATIRSPNSQLDKNLVYGKVEREYQFFVEFSGYYRYSHDDTG